ncbi:MAG: SLC13 family permease [Pseudomonadota bacterium]
MAIASDVCIEQSERPVARAKSRFASGHRPKQIGLLLGPALAAMLLLLERPDDLSFAAHATAALMVWMAVWWATEAAPIPVTSLLPLVILPLAGAETPKAVGASYGHHIVWLLFGGFVIATGIERWRLHKRIALNVVARAGASKKTLILGFMMATALLSMWISNTAATLMMAPIAVSTALAINSKDNKFAAALLLGVCYAASIGGVASPIGTPTNLVAMDWLQRETGISISFPQWMAVGVPAACLLIPAAWWIVARNLQDGDGRAGQDHIHRDLKVLGAVSAPEARVAILFSIVALLWVTRMWTVKFADSLGWSTLADYSGAQVDMMIAILGAIAMFIVPAGPKEGRALLTWEEAVKLPWGVILLVGGGMALGNAVKDTGLSHWIALNLEVLNMLPAIFIIAAVVALVIFLTELTSNVATMTTLAPVLGGLAAGIEAPVASFLAPAAIAASCAFMLPVATAPNAIVYASGKVSVGVMVRKGFWLNLIALEVITALGFYLAPHIL